MVAASPLPRQIYPHYYSDRKKKKTWPTRNNNINRWIPDDSSQIRMFPPKKWNRIKKIEFKNSIHIKKGHFQYFHVIFDSKVTIVNINNTCPYKGKKHEQDRL